MKVLISGAGIAGPALAYWLLHYGIEPTLIERAPKLRTGGYIIDFWGAGFDIAERMNLLPELRACGYAVKEVRVVNRNGKRVSGFAADAFPGVTGGRFASIPRGDLSERIFRKIEGKVETIFNDSVAAIEQNEHGVSVTFLQEPTREFDLVIGADGLHSKIRELVFGPQQQFEKYLGYKVAAFEMEGYRPRDELVYVMYTQVGQQVARFTMRDNRTMFLFIFKDDMPDAETDRSLAAQKELLREKFGNSGWECPQILDALDAASELYFDRVSQIRMNSSAGSWSRGRVALVGDAASCVSLLAGQGSALAMVAAFILAGELGALQGQFLSAFARYQELFEPLIIRKQNVAMRFAGSFAPKSTLSLFLRNQVMKAMRIPWIANWAIGRDMRDEIELPKY